jgi:hypothetical protein
MLSSTDPKRRAAAQVNAQYNAQARSLAVSATGSIKTDFMGVMGLSSLAVGARAVAVVIGDGTACVLALNKNASGAAIAQGSTTVNLSGCSLYDNSGNATALTVGGLAKLSALSVGVVGGISGNSAITTTQGVNTGISPIPDPYAKLEIPPYSGCDAHNFTAKGTVTIDPASYCGGMKLNAGADVTLNPGIYFIDRGDPYGEWRSEADRYRGHDHFYLEHDVQLADGIDQWRSQHQFDPAHRRSDGRRFDVCRPQYPGRQTHSVSMEARRNIIAAPFIYQPGNVTFAGGAGTGASCTKLIADTITFTGSSNFAIDCKGYGTKAFGPVGVRLRHELSGLPPLPVRAYPAIATPPAPRQPDRDKSVQAAHREVAGAHAESHKAGPRSRPYRWFRLRVRALAGKRTRASRFSATFRASVRCPAPIKENDMKSISRSVARHRFAGHPDHRDGPGWNQGARARPRTVGMGPRPARQGAGRCEGLRAGPADAQKGRQESAGRVRICSRHLPNKDVKK